MKFRTSGEIRRVDLEVIVDLLPALREEWAGLEFGADRKLINPLTGEHLDGLRLISA